MKRLAAILAMTLLFAVPCYAAAQNLRVDFYDVGKADAMLITTPQGHRILIDAATNKEGKKLVERFKKEGVSYLDMMIITHYDKDHVGGADHVLENIDVGTVVMPVYDKESKQHTQFVEALAKHPPQQVDEMGTRAQRAYASGDGVEMAITSAHERSYGSDEENDFSLAVRMKFGETTFLFAGDAENARQLELLAEGNVKCDVLKVPYHGRYEKSSPAFIAEAAPEIAFIHDDEEDPADSRVLALLEQAGAKAYCAKDGDLTVYSDGTNVWTE